MLLTDEHTRPDFGSCVLVVVDMQNDFVQPEGTASSEQALEILPRTADLVGSFREAEKPVAHVVRLYHPDGGNAERGRRTFLRSGGELVVPGTWGAQVAEGLLPEGAKVDHGELIYGEPISLGANESILYKPSWSAFFKTQLEWRILDTLAETVLVTGTWFPNCIRQTIYDAISLDYRVVAVRDCIAGITDKDCDDLTKVGCSVLTADEVAEAIK
ncbi:cysteine hydrolase family protein [Desulfovibrio oxyclinae]|uniref:cysteine hydrolase family protein n=1 Tax=Desulfovibrio oxyclinae TaxID=63560 RepID=UPI0003697C85|nr:isochorismatase family cysteine hydrolase [Desulfovibrio oxyclinae]